MKKLKIGLISLLAMLVVVMTGCQAVGGVDLNQAFVKNMDLKSYEGSTDFQLEFILNEDVELTEEEAQLLEWLDGFKLAFTNMKVENYTTMSMEGYVEFQEESLDFALSMKGNDTAIWVEGAKEPIIIPSQGPIDPSIPAGMAQLQELVSSEEFTEDMVETVKVLYSFFIKNFPNPPKVTVDRVTETIQGEEVELDLVHMELNGEQLIPLAKKFFENMLVDEEGMKETLRELHTILAPIILEMFEATADEADLEQLEEIRPYVENKELAVEFIHTLLLGQLQSFVDDFDGLSAELLQSEGASKIFNKNNVLVMDLYFDSDDILRKQYFELTVQGLEAGAVDGFRIHSTSEVWNAGGDVKADLLDTTNAVKIDENVTPEMIRNNFEESSLIYGWIEQLESLMAPSNNLEVTLDLSGNNPIPGYEQQPYINDEGYTMVPIRYVSEQLIADVEWDSAAKQVTVMDFLTGNVIEIVVDAKQANVGGVEVELDTPAKLHDGHLFVPLRFIVEAFDGEIEWDNESKSVTIVRSLFPF